MKAVRGVLLIVALIAASYMQFVAAIGVQPVAVALQPYFLAYAQWGINGSMLAYPGGVSLPLIIKVTYEGPVELYGVNATFYPEYPLSFISGEKSEQLLIPALEPGSTFELAGFFDVSANAHDGLYEQRLLVSYEIESSSQPLEVAEWVNFTVPILGLSMLRLQAFETYPSVIYAGERAGELRVYVVNSGNVTASGVLVSAHFSYPLSPLYEGSDRVYVGYLPAGRSVNLTFPFALANITQYVSISSGRSVAVPRPIVVNATVTLASTSESRNFSVPITVMPSAYFAVSGTEQSSISVGSSDDYVEIRITNVGSSSAKYVTLTMLMNPVFTPYAPSSENPIISVESINYTLGDVEYGSSANATFVIDTASGIKPGTYYLPILVTWYQEPTMQVMHQELLVPVSVKAAFSISSMPSGEESTLLTYALAAIIIVILIILVIIGIRRKR